MSGETLVVDANVAIKWLVTELGSMEADTLLDGRRLAAPDLLMAECANVLWRKVKRDEITETQARASARLLERSDIALFPMRGLVHAATELAIRMSHPAYDCIYLSLAVAQGWVLITADEAFARKVRRQPDRRLAAAVLTLAEAASGP